MSRRCRHCGEPLSPRLSDSELVDAIEALSHRTRNALFQKDVAEALGLPPATARRRMAALARSGLISRRVGRRGGYVIAVPSAQ